MLIRAAICAACLIFIAGSVFSLYAEPERFDQCCDGLEDCSGGLRCCDPGSIGKPPCSAELEGRCLVACVVGE